MYSFYPRNAPTPQCTAQTTGYKLISNTKFSFGERIENSFHSPAPSFPTLKKSFYKLPKIELIYVLRKACPDKSESCKELNCQLETAPAERRCLWGGSSPGAPSPARGSKSPRQDFGFPGRGRPRRRPATHSSRSRGHHFV